MEKLLLLSEGLRREGISEPLKEAEMIIVSCLGISRLELYRDDPEIDESAQSRIGTYYQRRSAREPLQYIFGYAYFYGLRISVGPGVLIPRPETEVLVEEAIATVKKIETQTSRPRILDLCTGSGCIAVALAREFPAAEVFGTDISEAAIRFAAENARSNGVVNARFIKGPFFELFENDLLSGIPHAAFDLIVSNPPYVSTDEIRDLQPEIRDWEPRGALDGGKDGLDYYRKIIPESKRYLKGDGFLMFEIGAGQAEYVRGISEAAGYGHSVVKMDYSGVGRIITIWR